MVKQSRKSKLSSVSNKSIFNNCSKKVSAKNVNLLKNKFNVDKLQKLFNSRESVPSEMENQHHSNKIKGEKVFPVPKSFGDTTLTTTSSATEPAMDSLRQRLISQVQSANFRILNERLYTSNSSDAYKLFHEDPEAFKLYHEGYASQVNLWPLKPLSLIISWLRKKPRTWKVADFGCGEALLSKSVPQTVISLDLVSANPKVIECDMAHTPLLAKSFNVVVICLSLMGTNISDFIIEANRVLVERGVLKIAEVESRFQDLKLFLSSIRKLGFKCIHKNQDNKFFWLFDFVKEKNVSLSENKIIVPLKPCIYKRR